MIYVRTWNVCVVGCLYLGLGVCVHMCEQVYMSVSATDSFSHLSDPTRRKCCWWPEDSQGCTVSSCICTEVAMTRSRWERLMLSRTYRGKRVFRLELLKVLYSTKVTCR